MAVSAAEAFLEDSVSPYANRIYTTKLFDCQRKAGRSRDELRMRASAGDPPSLGGGQEVAACVTTQGRTHPA